MLFVSSNPTTLSFPADSKVFPALFGILLRIRMKGWDKPLPSQMNHRMKCYDWISNAPIERLFRQEVENKSCLSLQL